MSSLEWNIKPEVTERFANYKYDYRMVRLVGQTEGS
jgi:hypothetical protein